MTADDINRYVGLPWQSGATGPHAFNCWGLLQHVQREYFGVELPDLVFGDAAREAYAARLHSGDWEAVAQPFHGAGVLLRGGDDPHVGIWLDVDGSGVLHSIEGAGVIWTVRSRLRLMGFSRTQYYRFHNGPSDCLPRPVSPAREAGNRAGP